MTTIYRCDNCGKDFPTQKDLRKLRIETGQFVLDSVTYSMGCEVPEMKTIGEYCAECSAKIEERVKAGVN